MKKYQQYIYNFSHGLLLLFLTFSAHANETLMGKWLNYERYQVNGIDEAVMEFGNGGYFRDENKRRYHISKSDGRFLYLTSKLAPGKAVKFAYHFQDGELNFRGHYYIKYDKRIMALSRDLPQAVYDGDLIKAAAVITKLGPIHSSICNRSLRFVRGKTKLAAIKLLKKTNCNVNQVMYRSLEELEIVRYLIESGFDINQGDPNQGKTLVMYLVNNSDFKILEYVMRHNPDLTKKDNTGRDVYQNIRFRGRNREIVLGLLAGKKLAQLQESTHKRPRFGHNPRQQPHTNTPGLNTPPVEMSGGCSGSAGFSAKSGLTNVALNKPASQSSSYYYRWQATADLAVDGNTDGAFNSHSVSHTKYENRPWWQVDLKHQHAIAQIVLWNRTDHRMGNRLRKFGVYILNEDKEIVYSEGFCNSRRSFNPAMVINLPGNIQGRYVKIMLFGRNYLQLAEVQVYGK